MPNDKMLVTEVYLTQNDVQLSSAVAPFYPDDYMASASGVLQVIKAYLPAITQMLGMKQTGFAVKDDPVMRCYYKAVDFFTQEKFNEMALHIEKLDAPNHEKAVYTLVLDEATGLSVKVFCSYIIFTD